MSVADPKIDPIRLFFLRLVMAVAVWLLLCSVYYVFVMHVLYGISGPDVVHQLQDLFFGQAAVAVRITLWLCFSNSAQTTLVLVLALALTGRSPKEPGRRGASNIVDRR